MCKSLAAKAKFLSFEIPLMSSDGSDSKFVDLVRILETSKSTLAFDAPKETSSYQSYILSLKF